jgi:hypothetical protein
VNVAWWESTSGRDLAQGDLLEACPVPVFRTMFGGTEEPDAPLASQRLIVATQSCDLVNAKVRFVALCVVHALDAFEQVNPDYRKKGAWDEVRKGRREALHLLPSPERPDDNRSAYVVDFGEVVSLPFDYLASHAENAGDRWRLRSPFREHFSQAFGRYFMRVGLPEGAAIPKYA